MTNEIPRTGKEEQRRLSSVYNLCALLDDVKNTYPQQGEFYKDSDGYSVEEFSPEGTPGVIMRRKYGTDPLVHYEVAETAPGSDDDSAVELYSWNEASAEITLNVMSDNGIEARVLTPQEAGAKEDEWYDMASLNDSETHKRRKNANKRSLAKRVISLIRH